VRRRVKEDETNGRWPPERLRHFRLEDWPGKLPISAKPPPEDCASCAFWGAKDEWDATHEPPDILACCPRWPDCGFTPPDDYFHQELI
jgi:hypothetical protein